MSNSKKIVKNTLFLYVRMFLIMGVSLYTSRVVLKTLGIEDFGIYNLVGSIVVLFSFLNAAMSSATQRFLNYEIGKRESADVNKVFCVSMNVHLFISFLILALSETVGLWFLNNKLNIPYNRLDAANMIYQLSIITTVINVLRVPYHAIILSNEKMSFYALLSIAESTLKLLIVYLLLIYQGDKLIMYGVLMMMVTIVVNVFYFAYCKKTFKEITHFKFVNDKVLFKEITVFSGWGLFGNVSLMASNQGLAFLLNMFFGVVINATMGIANQINAAVFSFISSLQAAFNPQIVQSYAEKNLNKHRNLVLQASKYSFLLILFIVIPILINTESLLTIWLGELPKYTIEFTRLILLISLIDALAGPYWMSAHAAGNIKFYQLGISFFLILNLPISYFLLTKGYSPLTVMILKLGLNFLTMVFRITYVGYKVSFVRKDFIQYLKHILILLIIGLLLIIILNRVIISTNILIQLISTSIISSIILLFTVLTIILNNKEKIKIKAVILKFKLKYLS